MADNTNQQTFPNSISQEELASRIAEEYDLPREEALKVLDGIAKLSGSRTVYLKSDTGTGTGFLITEGMIITGTHNTFQEYFAEKHLNNINTMAASENQAILRIQLLEEPLTAQSVSTAIAGITDLYIRCWFIQQKRFADLMDYAQTRDSRFVKEANLQVGTMSHNSPAIVDLLLNAGEIAGGVNAAAFPEGMVYPKVKL